MDPCFRSICNVRNLDPICRLTDYASFIIILSRMSMSHLYGRRSAEEDGVEIENFEITDWDLANEFNPDRRRHRQTKEQMTYGIWAERDSDEDERPGFAGKR